MNKLQLKEAFIEWIEKERTLHGWSQQEMASKLGMSVPGYRKMVSGLTESIAFHIVYRAAEVFQMPISSIYSNSTENDGLEEKLYHAPQSVRARVLYYLNYVEEMRKFYRETPGKEKWMDIISVTGYLRDGMVLDSYVVQNLLIKDVYGVDAQKGFLITEDTFLPAYEKGDILLVNEDVARNGDVTIMLNMKNKKLYIRKYVIGNQYELHPINGRGEIVRIEQRERKEWRDFGHVITSIHSDYVTN